MSLRILLEARKPELPQSVADHKSPRPHQRKCSPPCRYVRSGLRDTGILGYHALRRDPAATLVSCTCKEERGPSELGGQVGGPLSLCPRALRSSPNATASTARRRARPRCARAPTPARPTCRSVVIDPVRLSVGTGQSSFPDRNREARILSSVRTG